MTRAIKLRREASREEVLLDRIEHLETQLKTRDRVATIGEVYQKSSDWLKQALFYSACFLMLASILHQGLNQQFDRMFRWLIIQNSFQTTTVSQKQAVITKQVKGKIALTGAWAQTAAIGERIAGFRVTSDFGPRNKPCAGCSSFHKGVDLGTPIGTPVKAIGVPKEEVTVTCWNDSGGGGLVASFVGAGTRFDYLHLSKCFPGKRKVGSAIALTGSSGVGTAAHLHFQQRNDSGEKIPPQKGFIYFALTGKLPAS